MYAPLVQDDEAVGEGGFGGQLGDEDRGDAIAGAQGFQQGGYLATAVGIEQGGGFVQDQVARSHRHHRGNGHALFFAPREMVGRVVPIGLQVEGRQCLFDSPLYFVAGQGQILETEGQFGRDRGRDELVVGILQHHAHPLADLRQQSGVVGGEVIDEDAAPLRDVQAIQATGQRRLARAIGPDDRHGFARSDGEVDRAEGGDGPGKIEADLVDADHGRGR